MLERIRQTTSYLRTRLNNEVPKAVIVLGSGLGQLANEISDKTVIPYSEIPNFPVSTVEGHAGNLIIGELAGQRVLAMQGRFHYYEGYDMKEVTFPMRVFAALGIKVAMLSNAAGGVNPQFRKGDVMLITDHISFLPDNPLRGKNLSEFGPRFPDMTHAYDPQLIETARRVAKENGINLHEGVYIGVQGPSFETPAEYRFFHTIGADAVGMSTVPEVIVAVHSGMRVCALSVITNCGLSGEVNDHEDVQKQANRTEPVMTALFKGVIASL